MRKMSARHALIVAMLIAVVCAYSANLSQPAKAAANVIVASSSSYLDPLNDYWLFGEVKNAGDTPATNILIIAWFYDASGSFVNSSNTKIEGSYGPGKSIVLLPGLKAPFSMKLLPQYYNTVNFDHYGFEVEFEECAGKDAGLQIALSGCFRYPGNPIENVNVTGVIKNTGGPPQNWINVYATIYDSAGKAIGQGYWYKENLVGFEAAAFHFQVVTFYPAQATNFTLTAQSADYAIEGESNGIVIPEFPSFLILPLFMVATLLAVIVYKKKRTDIT